MFKLKPRSSGDTGWRPAYNQSMKDKPDKESLWSHLLNQTYPQALSEHSSSYSNAYEALTDNIYRKEFEGLISRIADKSHKPYWSEWSQGKTLTNKKNRNQIYIWIPARKEKYFNPANQLGLFNWSSAFWERKD